MSTIQYRSERIVCSSRFEYIVADGYSKVFDFDDWAVSPLTFKVMNRKWGPFTIDLFTSMNNFRVSKFYSKFWNPQCLGVDAFSFSWSNENCWIMPPIYLVNRVIKQLRYQRATGVLVVPKWKSAPFWPMIVDKCGRYQAFIRDYIEYAKPQNFFVPGSDKSSIFAKRVFDSNVLVLKI